MSGNQTARYIANALRFIQVSTETRELLTKKAKEKGVSEDDLYKQAFAELWEKKGVFNDATFSEYLKQLQ